MLRPLASIYYHFGKVLQYLKYKIATLRYNPQVVNPVLEKTIIVGNVVAGGAGKTPVSLALCKYYQETVLPNQPNSVHLISRGYGRKHLVPQRQSWFSGWLHRWFSSAAYDPVIRVDPQTHDATQVGDEPLSLALTAPTWVSSDRMGAILTAHAHGARVIIADDGYQTTSHWEAVGARVLVFSLSQGLGNGKLLPAGPLREPLTAALSRADVVIVIDDCGLTTEITDQRQRLHTIVNTVLPQRLPALQAAMQQLPNTALIAGYYQPLLSQVEALRAHDIVAFAGIGYPEKFYHTLIRYGFRVKSFSSFADHHFYTQEELKYLLDKSQQYNAILLTTRKDWLRLPPTLQMEIKALDIELQALDFGAIEQKLKWKNS